MGVRGMSALVAELPPAAAGPAAALDEALGELLTLRLSPLPPGQVRALGEVLERAAVRVDAARLQVAAAMDDRDDIVPKARAGQASVAFAQLVLGATPRQARRQARVAALVRADGGDLPRVGAAHTAGQITAGHLDVAVRTHTALGHHAREQLVPWTDLTHTAQQD